MIKIVAACGNGMGTSMIIKLKVEKAMKRLNIPASVEAMSAGQAQGQINSANIIICSEHLKDFFSNGSAKIATVVNLMSDEEIEESLKKVL